MFYLHRGCVIACSGADVIKTLSHFSLFRNNKNEALNMFRSKINNFPWHTNYRPGSGLLRKDDFGNKSSSPCSNVIALTENNHI